MARSSRAFLVPVAMLFASVVVAVFDASCDLSTRGDAASDDSGAPCASDLQCDDGDGCTVDVCSAIGRCEHSALKSGPSLASIPGNCLVETCHDGQLWIDGGAIDGGENVDPPVDGEPCTEDLCVGTKPVNQPLPDRTACVRDGANGVCSAGKCTIRCASASDCPSTNPCDPSTCDLDTGTCTFDAQNGGDVPGATQSKGDCQRLVCAHGQATEVADNADAPPSTTCQALSCSDRAVQMNPTGAETPCTEGGGHVCDGDGNCVGCLSQSDCTLPIGLDPACATPTCKSDHECSVLFATSGTPLGMTFQMADDCQVMECDGSGHQKAVLDASDDDDMKECTVDSCPALGTPKHVAKATGTACGVGGAQFCDVTGDCVGCNLPPDCGNPGACAQFLCTGNMCIKDFSMFPAGTATSMQTPHDCMKQVCDGMGNIEPMPDPSDVPLDPCMTCSMAGMIIPAPGGACTLSGGAMGVCSMTGVCCSTCQTLGLSCGAAPDGCGNTLTCDGLEDNGETDVDCGGSSCSVKCPLGEHCTVATDCVGMSPCADGFCCQSACTATCMQCTAAGTCSAVPQNQQDMNAAMPCGGTNACDGLGACKSGLGQACSGNGSCASGFCADGVCCNTACNMNCQACAMGTGICGNSTNGQPDGTCTGACMTTGMPGTMKCNNGSCVCQ